jgi:SAM-dependent methyltransferase
MTRYDESPYACNPIPCTAPEQLALAALLHGGPSPKVTGARVLEIGCGDGANLMPLAFFRPDCRFVGVDASAVQIDDARRSAERLALANVALHAGDIRDVGPTLGEFDYIVAHGVMSWVSDAVRDAIFALCRDHLAGDGLVYLSYNTNPGWLVRGLVRRSMLQPRARRSLEALTGEARGRAKAMRTVIDGAEHPYAQLLRRELEIAESAGESGLLHDYLAPHNRAYWFAEFAERAAGFGFRYLAEAPYAAAEYRVPASISRAARELEDEPLKIETLIDVLWYRQHRASLFCRGDAAAAALPRTALLERVTIAAGCRPATEPVRYEAGSEQTFAGLSEPHVVSRSSDPLDKAALAILAELWPLGIGARDLVAEARARLRDHGVAEPEAAAETAFEQTVLDLHVQGQAELRLRALAVPKVVSYPPALGPLTRWEVERRAVITMPTHARFAPTAADRVILARLVGERTPTELERELVEQERAAGAPNVPDAMTVEEWVGGLLARDLQLVSRWGLLQ